MSKLDEIEMRAPQVISTPEGIRIFQLLALKGMVKLESKGMKHSSGISMRKKMAIEFGLSTKSSHEVVIARIMKEVERLSEEMKGKEDE